jgi:AraC family transcriptional regulator of adaptative response/methylated-DNA-[protein]-cysteine methyltransferase
MSDYDRVAKAVDFIVGGADRQPRLDEVAAHVHLSPHHFQRLFSRWVGVTPKRFLQVLTVERAKALLEHPGMPLLDVADAVGLSSGSRLHDHFVHLEGVTPAEFRRVGQDLEIRYGEADTPFGRAFLAFTDRGVCKLAFVDGSAFDALSELRHDWPKAGLVEDASRAARTAARIFDPAAAAAGAAHN